jgi:ferredoxin
VRQPVEGEDGHQEPGNERQVFDFREADMEVVNMVMRVWIDREACTGDSLCEDICPDVFEMGDDSLAYVREDGKYFEVTQVLGVNEEGATGLAGHARVPAEQEESVIEAAEQCPGECIFVEVD